MLHRLNRGNLAAATFDNDILRLRTKSGRSNHAITTHNVHILELNGESHRLKHSRESASSQCSEEPDDV